MGTTLSHANDKWNEKKKAAAAKKNDKIMVKCLFSRPGYLCGSLMCGGGMNCGKKEFCQFQDVDVSDEALAGLPGEQKAIAQKLRIIEEERVAYEEEYQERRKELINWLLAVRTTDGGEPADAGESDGAA